MQCRHALLLSLAALSASLAAAPLPSYDFAVKDPWETRSKPSMKAKDKTDKALKYKGAVQLKNLDAGPDFSVKAEIRSPACWNGRKERMQHCIGANPPPGRRVSSRCRTASAKTTAPSMRRRQPIRSAAPRGSKPAITR